jgi:hypothetical protein
LRFRRRGRIIARPPRAILPAAGATGSQPRVPTNARPPAEVVFHRDAMATESSRCPDLATPPAHAPRALLLPAALAILCVDLVWCVLARWTIAPRELLFGLVTCAGPLLLLAPARYRRDPRLRGLGLDAAQFVLFTHAAALLSYLVVSTDAPLADARFAAWDRALGFDWPALYLWLRARPALDTLLGVAYDSALPQMAFLILYCNFAGRRARLTGFFNVLVLAFVVATLVAGCAPAAGAAKFHQAATQANLALWTDFEPLRAGTLKSFSLLRAQGLYAFPSFHTVTAIALAWAVRGTRLWPWCVALNALLIAATPTHGGHYLVDVLAGAATAAFAITVASSRLIAREAVGR